MSRTARPASRSALLVPPVLMISTLKRASSRARSKIDRLDFVLFHRADVFGVVAHREQSAVNTRVKCFHAPVHHFRKASDLGDVAHGETSVAQRFARAAGADDLNVEACQFARQI